MARLRTYIGYLSDEEAPSAANQNYPGLRQRQSLDADVTAPRREGSPAAALSEQEAEALQWLVAGTQSSQIADKRDVGTAAVKEHIKSVLRKVRGH